MGASDRDRADVPRPRPVWIDVTGHWRLERDWRPGILLEWRQVPNRRGDQHWEALVVWAQGGGELPWSLATSWQRQNYVRPMYPADP